MIRKYKEEDYDYVDKLIYDCFSVHKERRDLDEDHIEFVSVVNNRIVGYILFTKIIDYVTNKVIGKIDYFCIDKDNRNKGIGTELIEYVVEYAENSNVNYIELTSSRNREVARHIYEKEEFVIRDSDIFRRYLK